jgi:hypothetical protein
LNPIRYVEHVPYVRFVIRFTTKDNKRRRVVRWSPGQPWVAEEFHRGGEERIEMKRYRLLKPTHRIVHEDVVYAELRLYPGVAVKLMPSGEVQRTPGVTIESDIRDGRWHAPLRYLFGKDADYIPRDAKVVPI